MPEVFDFNRLEPGDGFLVSRVQLGQEMSLHLEFQAGGDYRNPVMISTDSEDPSVELACWEGEASIGDCTRLQLCLEAVARYLTTGGDWNQLDHALRRMKKLAPGGLEFPGWHYHNGARNTDGVVEHLFVANEDRGLDTPAVLWVEDSFIEMKTLGQIIDEGRQVDEGTASWIEEPPRGDDESWGQARGDDQLQLPCRPDPDLPQRPGGGPEG